MAKNMYGTNAMIDKIRPTAIYAISAIVTIVWMAFEYGIAGISEIMVLFTSDVADDVRQAAVSLLGGGLAIGLAMAGITAVGSALGSLVEKPPPPNDAAQIALRLIDRMEFDKDATELLGK